MPYNITPADGTLSITLENGDTQVLNLTESTKAHIIRKRKPVHAQPVGYDPSNPANINGDTTMRVVFQEQYYVMVHLSDGCPPLRIAMGEVDNQAGWTNDQAGANACVSAIESAIIPA